MKTILISLLIALDAAATPPMMGTYNSMFFTKDSSADLHFQVHTDTLTETLVVTWESAAEDPAVLQVQEVNGNMTLNLFLEAQPAGKMSKELSIAALSTGKYRITLELSGIKVQQELDIQRDPNTTAPFSAR
jgi:hypothetical protein